MRMWKILSLGLTLSLSMGFATAYGADDNAVATPGGPDAQMADVLQSLSELNGKPIETLSADEARKQPTPADAVKKLLKKQDKSTSPEEVGNIANKKISNAAGDIPIRLYTPKGDGPFPVLVYYHGGGFVIATIDTYDSSCRALCNAANCIVVSVEYRKAPENPYPAATDDAFTAYQWVIKNITGYKGDPAHIAVGGESAGGNLATVTCMEAAEKGAPMPIYELLVYPVTDNNMETGSYKENGNAKPLNKPMMQWFFAQYINDPKLADDPHVCPLKATDLSKMPPTTIITAQIDPLRDDGKAYADKLKKAGVNMQYRNYKGVTHEFFGMTAVLEKSQEAVAFAAEGLKNAFSK